MATKRLFQNTAIIFKTESEIAMADPNPSNRAARLGTLRVMASRMASMFMAENPRFNIDKFIEACAIPDSEKRGA